MAKIPLPQLTHRQQQLYADVTARSSDVTEQLMLLLVRARAHAVSSADVEAVRGRITAAHIRECRG